MRCPSAAPVVAVLLAAMSASACRGPPRAQLEISAQPAIVLPGEATRLAWRAEAASACEAAGSWSGARPPSGATSVTPPSAGGTYRLSCSGHHGSVTTEIHVSVLAPTPIAFPLQAVSGQRYLSDATGRPVLLQGDSGWSLIAATRREDVERYLDDRRARGFNAILINLLEHKFASHAPLNGYGVAPFRTPGDFSTPNDEYFQYADWVISRAEQRDMAVFLVPGYLGYDGGDEGWYQELALNAPDKLRSYGRYVGAHLGSHRNIVWVFGGDYNPPTRAVVTQIAAGVADSTPLALATAHCAPETGASQLWGGETWLTLNSAYTYRSVAHVVGTLLRSSPLPLVLIESRYEGEFGGTAARARLQAYEAMLSGAAGQFFGMSPLWHFYGPGNFPSTGTWQQGLSSAGSVSMTYLGRLLNTQRWWLLDPDTIGLLQQSVDMGQARATAAIAHDRSFAMVYVPSRRRLPLRLDRLAGPSIDAYWFDPTNGAMSGALQFVRRTGQKVELPPRGVNAGGDQDWVLLLSSH